MIQGFVITLNMLGHIFYPMEETFGLYLRIEVHFFRLHWEMKGHWSHVNLVKRFALLKDLHVTSVRSFPIANKKKVYFNLYIYAKVMKNP